LRGERECWRRCARRTSCRSGAQGALDRAGDLLARAGSDRAAQGNAPALGRRRWLLEPQVRKDRGLIDVTRDLFRTTLSGYMLSTRQLRSATVTRETDQVLSHQRHRPPRAFFPWGVGRRVDNDLTHDSPPRMVGIAARDKKPRERLCHPVRAGLGAVAVEVSQCGADATPVINRPGELPRSRPRLA
jgi:hypothetical protein